MEQKTPRAFTRTDLEAFFAKHWGASDYPKNELQSVCLLPEMDPPTWLIHYMSTWRDNDTSYYDLIVSQFPTSLEDQPWYLNVVTEVEIPQALATPTEEDTAIAQREEAEHIAWLRKQHHDATAKSLG